MASSTAVKMGEAFVEIGTKLGPAFQKGMQQAGAELKALGGQVATIGAGLTAAAASVLGPLTAAVTEFAASGDQLNKMAQRTGIAVKQLSALKFAAEQSGSSIEELENGVKRMQRTINDAATGMASAEDALGQLGMSVDQLQGLSPDEQFVALADALSQVEDATARAALAQEIFGRSGTQLLPLINGGARGIRELTDEAAELGIVMSTEAAQSAADFTDAWNRAKQSLLAVSREIAAAVLPAITALIETVRPYIGAAIEWIKNNQAVVITITGLATALGVAGVAITAFGGAVAAAGAALSALGSVIAAVLSPVGLLVAGITAVVAAQAALVVWALRATGVLQGLGQIFGDTFGGIISALQSGDLELAGEIALLGLEAIWKRLWSNMYNFAIDRMESLVNGLKSIGLSSVLGLDKSGSAFRLLRSMANSGVAETESALRAAVNRANAPRAAHWETKQNRELVQAMEDLGDVQQEAAATIAAAVGQQVEQFTNGGVGAGGLSPRYGQRGATNAAAAAMLAAGRNDELELLKKQFAELKRQTGMLNRIERDGGGLAVVGGT